MLVYYKLNYRVITLGAEANGDTVPVFDKEGEARYKPWLGFISPWAAKRLAGARPVRLGIVAYTTREFQPWNDMPAGKFMQGCLIDVGVFGILESGLPKLVGPSLKPRAKI